MLRLGIISERMTKREGFSLERFQKNVILCPQNPFELVVVRLPETRQELDGKPTRYIEKRVKKAVRFARGLGAEMLLCSSALKKMGFDLAEDRVKTRKREIFLDMVPRCIEYFAKDCGLELPLYKVCITTDKMDRITETLMERLCCEARNMAICTHDLTAAERVRERLFDERGLVTEILSRPLYKDCDVVVDGVALRVRIGRNVVVCGAELGFFTDGAEVDHIEIAACLKGEVAERGVSSYILNKKS